MALKSTVFKLSLSVSDMTRQYYEDHALTLARHPSETDLRMLVRVAVFALNANERLQFTKGLSAVDEPDLWDVSLTGEIDHWIDIGTPAEKRIRQSCSKARRVSIYAFQRGAGNWYDGVKRDVARFDHLRIFQLSIADEAAAAALAERSMKLSCMIEDEEILITDEEGRRLSLAMTALK